MTETEGQKGPGSVHDYPQAATIWPQWQTNNSNEEGS